MAVDPPDTYPNFFGHSTFIDAGKNTLIRLSLEKTYTTEAALSRSSDKRKCFTREETSLEHFDTYAQSNCLVDNMINTVKEKCGCAGRHRGKKLYRLL